MTSETQRAGRRPREYRPRYSGADDSRTIQNPPKSGCRCRNHMGTQKQQHKSKLEAIDAIMKRVLAKGGGSATPYECPTAPGIWHVGTQRRGN